MYILNGIVYANEPVDEMKIINVRALDDMIMIISFSTGETRLFDATELKGSAFLPLRDEHIFKNFKIVSGVITWMDEEIDCSPEYMYAHSYAYDNIDAAV